MYKAWHWHKSFLPKGHKQFWFKLILFSLIGHLAALFFGLFNRSNESIKLTVFSQKRQLEIVVLPVYKKIVNAQKMINEGPKISAKKFSVVSKKAMPKMAVKKVVAKKAEFKTEPKKTAPKKEVAKLDRQKVEKSKSQPAVKKVESAKSKPELIKKEAARQELVSDLTEPIYLGRQDLKNFQMAQELEAAIVKNWQPPMGFAADTECTVELVVDNKGKVTAFTVKKSSNIIVYDMSVKRIFNQIVMPASVRNKTLTIVFRQ